MPDIDALVAGWRESVAPLFAGREDALEELEAHLWEGIERGMAAGVGPEAAFRAATEKLGPPAAIAAEFARVPVVPLPWLPATVVWWLGAALAAAVAALLLPRLAAGGLDALLAAHMGGVILGYLASALVACLASCFLLARLFREPGPGQRATARQTATAMTAAAVALTAGGVALGCACPFEKSGWCLGLDTREVGGLAIAAWNAALLLCLWAAPRAAGRAAMALAAAGGVVVVLGSLAAPRVEGPGYGPLSSVPVIAALVVALAAVTLTALAPAGCLRTRRA